MIEMLLLGIALICFLFSFARLLMNRKRAVAKKKPDYKKIDSLEAELLRLNTDKDIIVNIESVSSHEYKLTVREKTVINGKYWSTETKIKIPNGYDYNKFEGDLRKFIDKGVASLEGLRRSREVINKLNEEFGSKEVTF
jgi:hypothetical protein